MQECGNPGTWKLWIRRKRRKSSYTPNENPCCKKSARAVQTIAILKELQLCRAIFNLFGAFAAIHLGCMGMPLNVFAFVFRFILAHPCLHF
jgi:hypothetical protein